MMTPSADFDIPAFDLQALVSERPPTEAAARPKSVPASSSLREPPVPKASGHTGRTSDALPGRVQTSDESSEKGKLRAICKKPSRKNDDDDDDDEGHDHDHQPLPSQDDDDDDDDHGLDGLDELLDVGNLEEAGGKAAKRPASKSSRGSQKKPAGRKKAEMMPFEHMIEGAHDDPMGRECEDQLDDPYVPKFYDYLDSTNDAMDTTGTPQVDHGDDVLSGLEIPECESPQFKLNDQQVYCADSPAPTVAVTPGSWGKYSFSPQHPDNQLGLSPDSATENNDLRRLAAHETLSPLLGENEDADAEPSPLVEIADATPKESDLEVVSPPPTPPGPEQTQMPEKPVKTASKKPTPKAKAKGVAKAKSAKVSNGPKGKPKSKALPKAKAKAKAKVAKVKAKACAKRKAVPKAKGKAVEKDEVEKKLHCVYCGAYTKAKSAGKSLDEARALANAARKEWVIQNGPRDHFAVKGLLVGYGVDVAETP
eukprot:s3522_g6.t2